MSDSVQLPATLPRPGDPKTLYVVDISAYVFRAYYALPPLSNDKGEATHAVQGVANMLHKFIRERNPAYLAIAMDSRARTLRKERYEAYKANRSKAPEDLKSQMIRVREVVEAAGMATYEAPGYEADDVIATVVRWASKQGLNAVIVSGDKDLLQLVDAKTWMYDTSRDRVFGPAETEAKMGVPPHQVRDLLALTGDSSDNVPGVPSVGPKTATKLLKQFDDLDNIYRNIDDIKQKGLREKLRANEDQARLSSELVSLHADLDLGLEPEDLSWKGFQSAPLREVYQELGFSRLVRQLGGAPRDESGSAVKGQEPRNTPAEPVSHSTVLDEESLQTLRVALERAECIGVDLWLSNDNGRTGDLLGLGLALSATESAYVPVGHRYIGAPEQLGLDKVVELMRNVLESESTVVRTEDLKKLSLYWSRHGIRVHQSGFDTGLASYLLHAERRDHGLRASARDDMDLDLPEISSLVSKKAPLDSAEVPAASELIGARARAAFLLRDVQWPDLQRDGLAELFEQVEVPLAFALAELETRGISLDTEMLLRLSKEVGEAVDALEARCHELAGHSFNVASPRQLETILFDELELPVVKRTKTARSTNQEVLEELSSMHELPKVILEYRGLAKLRNTYLDALPVAVDKTTKRVHSRFNQTVAQTGRLSSSDPNLQNIPIRTELGRRVRDAFVPREGWLLMAADYSQIELRVLAHLSGDEALLEAYREGLDVHARTASALFGVDEADVDRGMRNQGKTVNFAVIYGQTQFALARNLGISRPEAKRYIDAFFQRYAGVRDYMAELIDAAKRDGAVTTLMGRRRRLPELTSRNHNIRQAGERMARNTPIQGSAADIIKRAMVDVERAIADAKMQSQMLLTVHDELVFEAPPEEKEALDALVRGRMAAAGDLKVPLVVDVGWGGHWGDAH